MSCINVSGTKVVRAGKDLSEDAFLSDVQNKTVQSIMGATEKRRERAVACCIKMPVRSV